MSTNVFPARTTSAEIELGQQLQPKFGPDGLIPCITCDHVTNEVLMFAFMNAEALAHTIRTKKATYWSRSRNKLWIKGEESGNTQRGEVAPRGLRSGRRAAPRGKRRRRRVPQRL